MSRSLHFSPLSAVQRLAHAFSAVYQTSDQYRRGDHGDNARRRQLRGSGIHVHRQRMIRLATIAGVSAELAAVVPSAAPSALFFFKNRL